jgi:hypothetical protein
MYYFKASPEGYKLTQILELKHASDGGQLYHVQVYTLDFDKGTLIKWPGTKLIEPEDFEAVSGIPIDPDSAHGLIMGVFERVEADWERKRQK